MPKPIGRPYPVKAVDELYGELLLQVARAKEAVGWFDRTLARTPNRSRAVLGLARAHRNSGNALGAKAAYQRFLSNWKSADPGLPELAEAREASSKPASLSRCVRCVLVRRVRTVLWCKGCWVPGPGTLALSGHAS